LRKDLRGAWRSAKGSARRKWDSAHRRFIAR